MIKNLVTQAGLQAALKPIPEIANKNLYNLGEFDTYKSNGDGTATITRQTEYNTIKPENINSYGGTTAGGLRYFITNIVVNTNDVVANIAVKSAGEGWSSNTQCIYVQDSNYIRLCLAPEGDNPLSAAKEYLAKNPIQIQYKLATPYTEQVVDKQPIHIANQKECLSWHEEWRKGLNVSPVTYTGYAVQYAGSYTCNPKLLKVGQVYTISLKTKNTGARIYRNEDLFTPYANVTADGNEHSFVVTCIGNDQDILFKNETNNTGLMGTNGDAFYDIAIFEGTYPYPYEPYYGEIVRQKELSPIYFSTVNTSPASTIGGDWTSLGSFTIGSNTVYAWRRA